MPRIQKHRPALKENTENRSWRGDRMAKVRNNLELTQAQLSKKAKISQTTICSYELGLRTPSLINLKRICIALKISADYLVGIRPQDIRGNRGENR